MRRQLWLITGSFFLTLLPTAMGSLRNQPPIKSDLDRTEFWRRTSEQFSARSEMDGSGFFLFFFLFLIALGIAITALNYYYRQRRLLGLDDPRHLFTELVRAHGLGRTEQRFLRDFAAEMDLTDPLPLFIEPKYFLATLDDDRFAESKPVIQSLLKTLFGIERKDVSTPDVSVSGLYRGGTTIVKQPAGFDE